MCDEKTRTPSCLLLFGMDHGPCWYGMHYYPLPGKVSLGKWVLLDLVCSNCCQGRCLVVLWWTFT
jgi:hypothetical protein